MKNTIKSISVSVSIFISASVLLMPELQAAPQFTITIERNMSCSDQSTIGRLLIDGREIARTLELPWRNNEPNISRIPPGTYAATIRNDGSRKWRVELQNVPGDREHIQIHIGNYQRQIEGCVLVGLEVSHNDAECMVSHSKKALDKLADEMAKFALGERNSRMIDIQVQVK